MIHRRLTTSSLLRVASTLSSGCGAPIQTTKLVMAIIVWRDATTPIDLLRTVSRSARNDADASANGTGGRPHIHGSWSGGPLRGNYLYREAGEGTDEIVELAHGHTRFDRDDPGGESGQHSIPF